MSYSAQWEKVDPADLEQALSIEQATLSPTIEHMADDVKAAVAASGHAAAEIISKLNATGREGVSFKVSAFGHVRQHTEASTANLSITEVIDPVAPIADEQSG